MTKIHPAAVRANADVESGRFKGSQDPRQRLRVGILQMKFDYHAINGAERGAAVWDNHTLCAFDVHLDEFCTSLLDQPRESDRGHFANCRGLWQGVIALREGRIFDHAASVSAIAKQADRSVESPDSRVADFNIGDPVLGKVSGEEFAGF